MLEKSQEVESSKERLRMGFPKIVQVGAAEEVDWGFVRGCGMLAFWEMPYRC